MFLASKIKIISVFSIGALVAPLVALSACAGFPDKNVDPQKNTVAMFRLDMRHCADDYPETPDGVYIKQRISCMNLKGWR